LKMGIVRHNQRVASAVALSVVFLLVSVACPPRNGVEDESGLSQQARELFAGIPDGDYFLIGYLDLQKFADSDFGSRIVEFYSIYDIWKNKLGVGVDKVDRIAFAVRLGNELTENGDVIMLMSGSLDEDYVLAQLDRKIDYFKKEEFAGIDLYTVEEFGFASIRKGLVAIGTPDLLRSAVELAAGRGKALKLSRRMSAFEEFLRRNDSFWIGINDIDKIISRLAQREAILKGFTTLQSGFLAVAFDEDAEFRVNVVCKNEEDAAQIASSLTTLVGMLNFLIKNADFEDIPTDLEPESLREHLTSMLDSIDVSSSDNLVNIRFVAPQEIIDYLAMVTKEIVTAEERAPASRQQ